MKIYFLNVYCSKVVNHTPHQNNNLKSATTSTSLPARGVWGNWRNIFDTSNLHARTSESTQRRLCTGSRSFRFITSGGPQFNVKSRNAERFALFGNVLRNQSSTFKCYLQRQAQSQRILCMILSNVSLTPRKIESQFFHNGAKADCFSTHMNAPRIIYSWHPGAAWAWHVFTFKSFCVKTKLNLMKWLR